MGFVDGGTGSCSEMYAMCDVDGTKEVSFNVEEAMDIKDEIPKGISFPSIKTENEVRLCGVCEVVEDFMVLFHLLPQKCNREITLNYFLL
jgi:hypothetical protein